MKNLNLFLACFVLIFFISACSKDDDVNTPDNPDITDTIVEIGDFGLRKGECMATNVYRNGESIKNFTYNASTNTITENFNGSSNSYRLYELNENGEVINFLAYYNDTFDYKTAYNYNNESLLESTTYLDENDNITSTINYEYSTNACRLQRYCVTDLLDEENCINYTYLDDNCSYESKIESENINNFKRYILDNKKNPFSAITMNTGNSPSNILNYKWIFSETDDAIRHEEKRNLDYNEQGYLLSYDFYSTNSTSNELEFKHTTSYQYFCFE